MRRGYDRIDEDDFNNTPKDLSLWHKKMCDIADKLKYKGYQTNLSFNDDIKMFLGTIKNIDDLVYFECSEVDDIEKQFILAVDQYIEILSMKKGE